MIQAFLMTLSILGPLALGTSIAATLGVAGLVWIGVQNPAYLRGVGSALWNTADSYLLMAIPMFLLMGEILQRSLIAQRFYRALSRWLGWLPGGLLHSNIGACAVFSAVSGSSVATAGTIGAAAIPDLLRLGYPQRLVYGSLAAGGTLGILIPPSIPMIIYASITNVSVGRLFAAGILPGIGMALLFSTYIAIASIANRRTWATQVREDERLTWQGHLLAIVDVFPILSVMGIILIGIYSGWATPTEVAALGVVVALIVAALTGNLSLVMLKEATYASVRFTAVIVFVLIGAQIFSYSLTIASAPQKIAEWVASLSVDATVIMVCIILMYVILGTFMEELSMMVMTVPVVVPLITTLGFDPVWFGIVLVVLLEIGLLTPPVGINLCTIQALTPRGTPSSVVSQGAMPFVAIMLLGIALLLIFPQIALWLPAQLFR